MPATVNYSDVVNNGSTPALTPAANLAELQGRSATDLVTGARCQVIDEKVEYTWNGSAWEDEHALVWESIAANTGWSSQAYIAKVDRGRFAILRGNFTSTSDENTGSVFTFPTGYLPQNDEMRAAVANLRGGANYTKFHDVLTWSGAGKVLPVVQPGVADGDHVNATMNVMGAGGALEAVTPKTNLGGPNAGQSGILFVLHSNDTSNTTVVSWEVKATQASTTDCLRSAFGSDDVTVGQTYNSNDRVYVEGVYYALDPAQ